MANTMKVFVAAPALAALLFGAGAGRDLEDAGADAATEPPPSALDVTMRSIEGEDVNLAQAYGGRIVLIVNVASQCGYTPQYSGLQKLHDEYADQGLAVLGFPANNFGGQEPGTNAEILQFCTERFDVAFPMFAKVSVKGDDICPLYERLTDREQTAASDGEIRWNFEKFLLDREGRVVKHYRSKATPEQIAQDIEPLLKAEPPATFDAELAARLGADDYGMKRYVMAFLKAGPNRDQDPEAAAELQRAHLDNIGRLAAAGKLVLAGPFLDDGELRGIYIFNVETIEEARALTETDPAVKAGRLIMELHPWYGSAALQEVNAIHQRIARDDP